MIQNRRSSRIEKGARLFLARLWQARFAIGVAMAYAVLFAWLFSGSDELLEGRPIDFSILPQTPEWAAPSATHRFGTTAEGEDLYALCRAAMAQTSAFAVLVTTLGVLLSFLFALLFVFDEGKRGGKSQGSPFRLLRGVSESLRLLPAALVLLILGGGSEGGPIVLLIAFTLVIGLYGCGTVAEWFEQEDLNRDRIAGEVLGFHRPRLVKSRSIPAVVPRLIGLASRLFPSVLLLEMAISFFGFSDGSLSCGILVASGTGALLEAPWVTIYPGIFAGVVVLMFSILGRVTNHFLRSGEAPDIL